MTGALANIPFPFGIDSNGNYGYRKAGADTVTPFKSDISRTTLWTNSSPTSSFSTTTITLSQSMTNFTYLEIYYKNTSSGSLYQSTIYKVSDVQKFSYVVGDMNGIMGTYRHPSDTYNYVRIFSYVSNTQLNISPAHALLVEKTSTSIIVPCYIYGLK